MARITGRQAKFGLDVKANASFGTATAATKAFGCDSLDHTTAPTKLFNSPLGRAESMLASAEQGAKSPTVDITGKLGFNNGYAEMLATFFGTSAAPAEQTAGQGDYLHILKFNETRQAFLLTLAAQATSSELFEWTDALLHNITLNYASPFPSYIQATMNFIASQRVDNSGAVNTYAGLTGLTAVPRDEIKASTTSRFRINADGGGALANGDTLAVTSVVVNYSDPLEVVQEMSGNTYNSIPNVSDLFMGTVVATLRGLTDFTYLTAAGAGTTYKADIVTTGAQIGSGQTYTFQPKFPLLKIVEDPKYTYAKPGYNEFVVTFDMFKRSATPTGMSDSYPHIHIINTQSTSLLA